MRKLNIVDAVQEAVKEEMENDENVFVIGEDVGEYGGVWGTYKGLYEKYGKLRAMDTPISESGIIGLCTSAAAAGLRPIAEIMYMDFMGTAMDQIINQAAKLDLMSGWQLKVPMVIRMPYGIGTREAAHHSQSFESWFLHTPGFMVAVPSNAYDAKGLLKTAIRDDRPVIFMEHRLLYNDQCEVSDNTWTLPLGKANVIKQGEHITIVSYGRGIHHVKKAMELMPKADVELIDLRTIVPLDIDTIIKSVKKTGRLLVVHEAPKRGGVGAEIVRSVVDKGFDYLDAEPRVYGGLNTPIPFSPELEDLCLIDPEKIKEKAMEILTGVI